MKTGYTIIELLIIIGIIAVLITFTLTAYSRSQARQSAAAAKEAILAVLQNAQKAAYVGDKDCDGALLDIQVSFTGSSISRQARCDGGLGTPNTTVIGQASFITTPTVYFRPLDQGVVLPSGSSVDIDYQVDSQTYRVRIERPGTITYQGAQ